MRAGSESSIVVGTDGSQSAAVAVRAAATLARERNATLHVVAACPGAAGHAPEAWDVLTDVDHAIRRSGVRVRLHAIADRPSSALCQVASLVRADLIVVGNKGSEWMLRTLQRPICERVKQRAPCQVVVVDTRAHWVIDDDGAPVPPLALTHAEPMAVRIDRARRGPRLYLGGLRLHHGLTGELLALDGLRRRGRLGLAEVLAGLLLMGDDWHDFPFSLRDC
jgi:nucleotide-binding universal stress UspA family protein